MNTAELCVYCRVQPVDSRWRPFCSERCHLLDLAHWLDGAYRVEGPSDGPTPGPDGWDIPDDPDEADL